MLLLSILYGAWATPRVSKYLPSFFLGIELPAMSGTICLHIFIIERFVQQTINDKQMIIPQPKSAFRSINVAIRCSHVSSAIDLKQFENTQQAHLKVIPYASCFLYWLQKRKNMIWLIWVLAVSFRKSLSDCLRNNRMARLMCCGKARWHIRGWLVHSAGKDASHIKEWCSMGKPLCSIAVPFLWFSLKQKPIMLD